MLPTPQKRLNAIFFQTPAGREPVKVWLRQLSALDRGIVGTDISRVEFLWPLGRPFVGSSGHGLWEVRSNMTHGSARVMFMIKGNQIVLLHAFTKQTQKTPLRHLKLAIQRMKGVE